MTEKEYSSAIGYEYGSNPYTSGKEKAKFDKYFANAKKLIEEYLKKDKDNFNFEHLAKILFTSYPDKEIQTEGLPFTINIVKAILIISYPNPKEVEEFITRAQEWDEKVQKVKAGDKNVKFDFFNQPRRPVVVVSEVIRDIMRYVSFVINDFSDCEKKNPKLAKYFDSLITSFKENFDKIFFEQKTDQSQLPNFMVSFFEQTHNRCNNIGGVGSYLAQFAIEDCVLTTKDKTAIDLPKMMISVIIFYLWLKYKNETDFCQMDGKTIDEQHASNVIQDDDTLKVYGGSKADDEDDE